MKYPVNFEIIPNPNKIIQEIMPSGDVFISSGSILEKSSDYGKNTTSIKTFANNISRVKYLNDGTLIVILNNNTVHKSDVTFDNFTETYTMLGRPSAWGSFDAHDRIVLIGEYAGDSKRVHYSGDYGATWRVIWNSDNYNLQGFSHVHDVRYDPYEGLIWVVTGDGAQGDMVYVTDNYGKTWETLHEGEYRRYTNIMPFPDAMYFGTDEFYELGVDVYDRPLDGSFQSEIIPKSFWRSRKNTAEVLPFTWSTVPAMVYDTENPKAFWGNRLNPAKVDGVSEAILPATVYYLDRDKRVYTLWKDSELPGSSIVCSIEAVHGPDDNGIIVADLRTLIKVEGVDVHNHILKIQT